ncbi:MAG: cupredoxin domain-containing protein, partial [Acidimicrobiales bacterium]
VALGTMVEAVFAPVASGGEPSAEARAKLPQFFDASAPVLPLSEPLQAGAQPCFVASGPVPTTAACSAEQQAQPATFTGAQAIYSSGFLPDEAKFTVKLDEGIEPGVYHFMCLVHGADESGTITVVPTGTTIPTPAQVAAEAQAKFDTAVTALRPAAEQVQQSTSPRITVGAEVPGGPGLEFSQDVNVFPKEVTVAAGQAVTWTVNDAHTVSFNAPEDARPLYVTDADGVVRANRKGADPSNGPGQQPPQAGAAPTGPTVIDGGRFDGSGFRSSGLLVSLGAPVEYTLAFTKAGTYKYRCLFHLDMEGVVKVS